MHLVKRHQRGQLSHRLYIHGEDNIQALRQDAWASNQLHGGFIELKLNDCLPAGRQTVGYSTELTVYSILSIMTLFLWSLTTRRCRTVIVA